MIQEVKDEGVALLKYFADWFGAQDFVADVPKMHTNVIYQQMWTTIGRGFADQSGLYEFRIKISRHFECLCVPHPFSVFPKYA